MPLAAQIRKTSYLLWPLLALLSVPGFCQKATQLPDGPGKTETVKLCVKCHTIEQTISLRQGRAQWQETIAKMVNIGAQGSTEEFNSVLTYLVKNYGPANGGSSTAAAVGPQAAKL